MLPILGALILQSMYGTVDLLIVGQFETNEGISAISTGSNRIGENNENWWTGSWRYKDGCCHWK